MDNVTKATRSRIMASIKSRNTSPERKVFIELKKHGVYFQRHYQNAAGSPDIAIPSKRRVVFIDGDFWHGFRYPAWKKRLKNKFWRDKIERNRRRDKFCHRALRNRGWLVMRVWEHQISNNFNETINSIVTFLK